jgi:glycosyltransferase involved in cell wall biosynthesis
MSPEQRKAGRKNINLPEDAIVLFNANRNSQLKRLDLTISGFVRLMAMRPNEKLYLIMVTNLLAQTGARLRSNRIFANELKENNLNPVEYGSRILFIDSASQNIIPDDGINMLYNITDIGINTSDGEGYGLCQLEHMYTGSPQVVTDIGSYRSFLDEKVARNHSSW